MDFRQLLPEPGAVDVQTLLGSLGFGDRAPAERPYTLVNFIATVDGRATFHGRSRQLGDDGDRAMFHGLREQVDAVLAGIGTLRTERYGRMLRTPERRERRLAAGRPAEPLACVISRSGDIPLDIPLFAEPEARVVVFSPVDISAGADAQVEQVRLDPGALTLTTVLRTLRSEFDVRSLLCEGGPTLFGGLVHEQVTDELFLTVAPKLAGGGMGPAITAGSELPDLAPLKLEWLLEREQSLYLRYSFQ